MAMIAALDWEAKQADAVNAFLNSDMPLEAPVYVQQPHGYKAPGDTRVCKLDKALYGMCDSPLLWYETLTGILAKMGFHPLNSDQCVFFNDAKDCLIIVYVDDFIVAAATTLKVEQTLRTLGEQFEIKELGDLHFFLGCRITRDRYKRALYISQESYLQSVITKFGFDDCQPADTPMVSDHGLVAVLPEDEKEHLDHSLSQRYQALTGSLMWPATQSRPDIAYAVGVLCRFLCFPGQKHLKAAHRIVRYLKGTLSLAIGYVGGNLKADITELQLRGYSDSSFADCKDTRKSTSGFIFYFLGGPITWKSGKQPIVTTSTAEAEYVALSYAAKECIWLRRLAAELGINVSDATCIYGDNEPSIKMLAKSRVADNSSRTKHMETICHFIRQTIHRFKAVKTVWLRTDEQAADGFTKALDAEKHAGFLHQLAMVDIHRDDDKVSFIPL